MARYRDTIIIYAVRIAAQKVTNLEMMLGQIANYAPIISWKSIVKSSASITGVWQTIRQHYGLQLTGSCFLDLANIYLKPEQRPAIAAIASLTPH